MHSKLFLLMLITIGGIQALSAHVLFNFGFDFTVKNGEGSKEMDELFDITLQHNQISITDNLKSAEEEKPDESTTEAETESESMATATSAPASQLMTDIWAQQHNVNAVAQQKLRASSEAIVNLNRELAPVVGRSDYIAAKVKLNMRYLNAVAASDNETSAGVSNKFQILRKFVQLVDELRVAPDEELGGERSMDYVVMSLAMHKHELGKLQAEVQQEVLQAEAAWQRFVKSKLIEVAV